MRPLRVLACLTALSLLLAACGGDDSTEGGGGGEGADGCEAGATVTTESGLEYEELECGDGDEVARGDTVTVHYTGTLENGDEFDSSRDGEPATFTLESGSLIEGWVEGIPGMKEGGRRELTIPPDLGYGEAGNPPVIPGGATLVFDVEVIEVQKP